MLRQFLPLLGSVLLLVSCSSDSGGTADASVTLLPDVVSDPPEVSVDTEVDTVGLDGEDSAPDSTDVRNPEVTEGPVERGLGEFVDLEGVCGEASACGDGLRTVAFEGFPSFCARECDPRDSDACAGEPGLVCGELSNSGATACVPGDVSCSSDSDCDFGETFPRLTCVQSWTGNSSCLPRYLLQSDEGASCGDYGADRCITELCDSSMYCNADGACELVVPAGVGEVCDVSSEDPPRGNVWSCEDNNRCYSFSEGDTTLGVCAQPCSDGGGCENPQLSCVGTDDGGGSFCQQACTSNDDCAGNGETCTRQGYCFARLPIIVTDEGDYADHSAGFYRERRYCAAGLEVPGSSAFGPCLRVCETIGAPDGCGEGDICAQLADPEASTRGSCAVECDSDSDCGEFSSCVDDNSGEVRICLPLPPPGNATPAAPCRQAGTTEALICQPGLVCLGIGGADPADGFCTGQCETIDDCRIVDGAIPVCVPTSAGFSACAYQCSENSDCPDRLDCVGGICGLP